MYRLRVQFPIVESEQLDQDEVYFYLHENGDRHRFRFHDYGAIYDRPGLYEQIFYDRLKCESPKKVASTSGQTKVKNTVLRSRSSSRRSLIKIE